MKYYKVTLTAQGEKTIETNKYGTNPFDALDGAIDLLRLKMERGVNYDAWVTDERENTVFKLQVERL